MQVAANRQRETSWQLPGWHRVPLGCCRASSPMTINPFLPTHPSDRNPDGRAKTAQAARVVIARGCGGAQCGTPAQSHVPRGRPAIDFVGARRVCVPHWQTTRQACQTEAGSVNEEGWLPDGRRQSQQGGVATPRDAICSDAEPEASCAADTPAPGPIALRCWVIWSTGCVRAPRGTVPLAQRDYMGRLTPVLYTTTTTTVLYTTTAYETIRGNLP